MKCNFSRMQLLIGLAVVSMLATVRGMYDSSDHVVELNEGNFDRKVIESEELWIVEFYAPWCGHCQALTPEWKKAANSLKGIANIAAVDADKHQSLGGRFGVKGFPTIKIFGLNKGKPSDYSGGRTAQAIVDTAISQLQKLANARLSGKKSSGGDGRGGSKSSGGAGDPKDVIELTDSNFDDLVLNSNDMWLVEFFAPWCGHCKNLAPHWQSAASELKGKVKLGAVDATVHSDIAGRYGVRGYPTIKMFAAGSDEAVEYDGGRTSSDIVQWALDKVSENVAPPEVKELTDPGVLSTACEDHQLCLVAILPHILDCQMQCRNDYIDLMKKMGDKYKKRMWGWAWAEAGSQHHVEQALGIGGFGYPAMAAVNSRKMKFVLMRGSFSETGVSEFLRALAVGRGSSAPLPNAKLPEVKNIDPWDGKDGEMPVEEDLDLSDVVMDEFEEENKAREEL